MNKRNTRLLKASERYAMDDIKVGQFVEALVFGKVVIGQVIDVADYWDDANDIGGQQVVLGINAETVDSLMEFRGFHSQEVVVDLRRIFRGTVPDWFIPSDMKE